MEQTTQGLSSNFWKIYGYSFFQMFLVAIPVLVPYWQSHHLNYQDIFWLQGIFGVSLLIFDAPAGYLADLMGRKKTMVLGSLITALAFQMLWLGNSFTHFLIYEVILGLGISLQSGCDIAILYTTHEELHRAQLSPPNKGRLLGYRITTQYIGEGSAALLAGFLAKSSLSFPIIANAITPWLMVLFALMVKEPKTEKLPRGSHLQNFKLIGNALFRHSKLLTLVILNFIVYSFATYCATWSLQPYWQEKKIPIESFGYIWALLCFLIALIGHFAHRLEQILGSTRVVVIIGLTPIIGYLGMGLSPGWMGLIFIVMFPICRGLNAVIFQEALNTRIPDTIRATANSIGSLGMRILFVIFGPWLGHIIDQQGASSAMTHLGIFFILSFFVLIIPLLRQRKSFQTSEN